MGNGDEFDIPPFALNETFVCADCVVDDALVKVVNDNLGSTKCDCCGKVSKEFIAASFNDVMERIYDSICTEYADAQDINVPWVEGGWMIGETDQWEILYDINPEWPDKFSEDVNDSLGNDRYWVQHSGGDWSLTDPSGTLKTGWDLFKSQVLTKTRYLFLTEPDDDGRPDYIAVSKMLNVLGSVITGLELIIEIPTNSEFYRVRVSKDGAAFGSFEELGLPPHRSAGAGRMNPVGIPYFYLARDSETAKAEVIYTDNIDYGEAVFINIRPLKILDLTSTPNPPSFFEPDRYYERHQIYFISQFKDELTQPVKKDGREHVDYVPTQIVSEYFKHRFTHDGEKIDGIMYPSVKHEGGVNIAIFISDNDSAKEVFILRSLGMKKA